MGQDLIDKATGLMGRQRFGEALSLLRRVIAEDQSQWNAWYMAGQCCRFLKDADGAIECLTRAAALKPDQAPVFLALGIALQVRAQWVDAVGAFRHALEIDRDYALAYNSLALTQKHMGDLDKALHTYDAGAKALARRIVVVLRNTPTSPILKHRDTRGALWVGHAGYAALYLISTTEGIRSLAMPTGEQAIDEERTEKHRGMYWTDELGDDGQLVRHYLPNYFNTFRESLRMDSTYSNLIGNRGTVLNLLGRHEEARLHTVEATELLP